MSHSYRFFITQVAIAWSFATGARALFTLLVMLPFAAIALDPADDLDNDNMLDSWEVINGLNPADPSDALTDNDGDGVPNRGEYLLSSDPNDLLSLPAFTDNYVESFESGTLPAPWFVPTLATGGWQAKDITASDGNWSLESDQVPGSGGGSLVSAEVVLPIYVHYSKFDLRYYWNAFNNDYFRIYVDDVEVFSTTNAPRTWAYSEEFFLDEGYHEIRFNYDEGFGSQVCQCTRIDDLQFTLLDEDTDGIPNDWEQANGLNPNDPTDALLDSDSDGLINREEFQQSTDPANSDSDADGLSDGEEINLYSSNPLNNDSDADGLPDGYEASVGLDLNDPADADEDPDSDGVATSGEVKLGTDPFDSASTPPFNDNYFESFESGVLPPGWNNLVDADGTFAPATITASDGSYSLESEQIADGETAIVELFIVTNLSDLQFDHYLNSQNGFDSPGFDEVELRMDGELIYSRSSLIRGWSTTPVIEIPRGYHEFQFVFRRKRAVACRCLRIDNIQFTRIDNDIDGMRDEWELEFGLDPTDPSDAILDSDYDGIINREEYLLGTKPNTGQSDDDWLDDYSEVYIFGTDPTVADTDGDLINDDYEAFFGLDPLDAANADLDSDTDGYTDLVEYRLGSNPVNAASVPALQKRFDEDFEDALSRAWFNPRGGAAEWQLTTDDASTGDSSLRNLPHPSGNLDSKYTAVLINVAEGILSIDYKNIEALNRNGDFMRVRIDGNAWFTANANQSDWRTRSRDLEEGLHIIEFEHRSGAPSVDTAYAVIDNLRYRPFDGDEDLIEDQWEIDNGLNPDDPSDAKTDLDNDGLTNEEEYWLGSLPGLADSDADGLDDLAEARLYGTSLTTSDTDNDRMDDGYEIANGLDPRDSGDKTGDLDNDGVSNFAEALLGTSASDPSDTPPFTDNIMESFESGVLPANWTTPPNSDLDWAPENLTGSDGTWSLRSGTVRRDFGSRRTSRIQTSVVVHESDFQFSYYWHSSTSDLFSVYIDDELVFEASETNGLGERYWKESPVFRLTEGYHEIRFDMEKISFPNVACGCVRIDNLRFTLRDTDTDRLPDDYETANGLNPNDAGDASLDTDGDGLSNFAEWQLGTLANNADTDGDGLNDGEEVDTYGTNPSSRDSDDDELTDGWELANGLNPLLYRDAYEDPDGDGVFTLGEFRLGRDHVVAEPLPPYNDNYSEAFESGVLPTGWIVPANADAGWQPTTITASEGISSLQSEPISPGQRAAIVVPLVTHLSDVSFWYYWNAGQPDDLRVYVNGELATTGLKNRTWWLSPKLELKPGYNEIRFEHNELNPLACQCTRIDQIQVTRVDADGDGMRDTWELENGLDPTDASDGLLDSDGDGLNNAGEYAAGSSLTSSDTDSDGLSDADEFQLYGTDATAADSDGDTLPDSYELANGLEPRRADGDTDTDGDGYTNWQEWRLGALPNDAGSIPGFIGDAVESFESGPLGNEWYASETGAPLEWAIVSTDASEGSSSLGSAAFAASTATEERNISWLVNTRGSFYTLDHKVLGSATLRLSRNNVSFEVRYFEGGQWLNTDDSPYLRNYLPAGIHEFHFNFRAARPDGTEQAWIDNIRFNEVGSP